MDDYNNQNNFNPNNQNNFDQNSQNNFNQNNQYNQPYQYQQGGQYNPNQQFNQAYQYPQYQETPEPGKNFAIASLVLGIVTLVCCGNIITAVLGVIFGIISKQRQKENNGMATAGLIISIVGIVLWIIAIVFLIATDALASYSYFNYYY